MQQVSSVMSLYIYITHTEKYIVLNLGSNREIALEEYIHMIELKKYVLGERRDLYVLFTHWKRNGIKVIGRRGRGKVFELCFFYLFPS